MNYQEIFKKQLETNPVWTLEVIDKQYPKISSEVPADLLEMIRKDKREQILQHVGEKMLFYILRDYTKKPIEVCILSLFDTEFSVLDGYTFVPDLSYRIKDMPEFEIR